jgi:hypothetical protein
MLITRRTSKVTLYSFVEKLQPGGPGWSKIYKDSGIPQSMAPWFVKRGMVAMLYGSIMIYSALLGTGYWIYGQNINGSMATGLAMITAFLLIRQLRPANKVGR